MTKPSLIEALNVAIKSQEFFDKLFVVRQQDVLERNFPDVISLNTCLSEKRVLNFINQKIHYQSHLSGRGHDRPKNVKVCHVIKQHHFLNRPYKNDVI